MKTNSFFGFFLLIALMFFPNVLVKSQSVFFVNINNSTPGNGQSWNASFQFLQDALSVAESGDQIWVAEGVYKPDADSSHPTGSGNRESSFCLLSGLEIYGGFSGVESSLDEREPKLHETILSGEINSSSVDDNSYHVVYGEDVDATAVLDGFTIKGGYADGIQPSPPLGNIIYVDSAANADSIGYYGDGTSWETAFNFLYDAFEIAGNGDEIWVATGTYYPDKNAANPNGSGDRQAFFELNSIDSIGVYGGFEGVEPASTYGRSLRNWIDNPVVLSGEIGDTSLLTDNSRIVLNLYSIGLNSVVDGFHVCGAYNLNFGLGGGAHVQFCGCTIQNCHFFDNQSNRGGGVFSVAGIEKYMNCRFTSNLAVSGGGAIAVVGDSLSVGIEMDDCAFSGNHSGGGGALYAYAGSVVRVNRAEFSDNSANNGGAVFFQESSGVINNSTFNTNSAGSGSSAYLYDGELVQLSNCVFLNNFTNPDTSVYSSIVTCKYNDVNMVNCSFSANKGARAIYNVFSPAGDTVLLTNCILWNDSIISEIVSTGSVGLCAVSKSDIQGQNGGGSIDMDPLFNNPFSDLSLQANSPCIDAADGDAAPPTDILGNARVDNPNVANTGIGLTVYVDMGAYEWQGKSGSRANKKLAGENRTLCFAAPIADNDKGGGVLNINSAPMIINCMFYDNSAIYGAAVYNGACVQSPVFHNCRFINNQAEVNGGAIFDNSLSIITNSIFKANVSELKGGAIYNTSVPATGQSTYITNCTFCGNFAEKGKAIVCENSSGAYYIHVTNSILWDEYGGLEIFTDGGSIDVCYSDVFKGYPGTGNISDEPKFIDPCEDLHLDPNSACVDAGSNTAPYLPEYDLDGNPRIHGISVDMGVYEYYQPTTIIYVDADANADTIGFYGDGASWESAFNFLQDALAVAEPGNEIWVAEGAYYPDENALRPFGNGDRSLSFSMMNQLKIYGGFEGIESVVDERDWLAHPTILSGDLRYDNSYHIFYHTKSMEIDTTALLDGFILEHGYANDANLQEERVGAAIFNATASPTLTNCTFRNNSALAGGAVFNTKNSSPIISHCVFYSNSAIYGAAIGNNLNSSPFLEFCTVADNTASAGGGMRSESNSFPEVKNSIFWANSGGQINSDGTSSTTVNYSDIQTGWNSGEGNFNENPDFVNPAGNNYFLLSKEAYWNGSGWQASLSDHSPCIDAADIESDWLNEPENNGHRANLGAYGNTRWASKSNSRIIYVDANTSCINPPNYFGNGDSWEQAYKYLTDALAEAIADDNYEIWVSKGAYKPDWDTALKVVTGDRTASFVLKKGVKLYGGFDYQNGIERFEERDWEANPAILSGDIGVVNDFSDNSYHVIFNTEISNLDHSTLLDGFTVTRGFANGNSGANEKNGGGMFLEYGNPTLINCVFDNNFADGAGGGLYCGASSPALSHCIFNGNSAKYKGGGLAAFFSSPDILYSQFLSNECTDPSGAYAYGGGLYLEFADSPSIINTLFENNLSSGRGGGAAVYSGIHNTSCLGEKYFSECEFLNNSAIDHGGALLCMWSSKVVVSDCSFESNQSGASGGALCVIQSEAGVNRSGFVSNSAGSGGAVYVFNWESCVEEEVEIRNSVFSANEATEIGGAISYHGYSSGGTNYILYPQTINCSFFNNEAGLGNTISNRYACPDILNCIIWGENYDHIYEGSLSGSNIDYSDVRLRNGVASGIGNINEDPLFFDPFNHDLHLKSTNSNGGRWDLAIQGFVSYPDDTCSPCINAGIPFAAGNEYSFYENEPEDNGDRINMGAFGNTYQASKSCASKAISGSEEFAFCSGFSIEASPNPVSQLLNIDLYMPKEGKLGVEIYNAQAVRIATLFNGEQSAGKHSLYWNTCAESGSELANGIYFLKCCYNNEFHIMKLILSN